LHFKTDVLDDPEAEGAIVGGDLYLYTMDDKLKNLVALANADPPTMAVATGDIVHIDDSYASFANIWDTLDASIRKAVTLGNHEWYTSQETIESGLGYDAEPENAGSKFNQSFRIDHKGFPVRVIMLDDTNGYGDDGDSYLGACPEAVRNWIADELAACDERIVLIFAHMSPHTYADDPPSFIEEDALALKAVVDAAVESRGLKVFGFFGHEHGANVQTYDIWQNFPGYIGPALVENETADFVKIDVYSNGTVGLTEIPVVYPYPPE
jgi:hypothetical protein